MKQLLPMFIVLLFALPASGQDQESIFAEKNEINLGFFNAFELNGNGDLGIGYKRMGDRGAFRTALGLDYSSRVIDRTNYREDQLTHTFTPRIGYEFHRDFNRLRLFYGGDVQTRFYLNSTDYTYDDPDSNRNSRSESFSVGLRPFLGLTVFVTKTVSISTETFMNIGYYQSTNEETYISSSTTYESKGMDIGLGPLGLVSVNLHF
ncbi:MAG: hypothetical protein R2751_19075 [Bacteroidales bacterium]